MVKRPLFHFHDSGKVLDIQHLSQHVSNILIYPPSKKVSCTQTSGLWWTQDTSFQWSEQGGCWPLCWSKSAQSISLECTLLDAVKVHVEVKVAVPFGVFLFRKPQRDLRSVF